MFKLFVFLYHFVARFKWDEEGPSWSLSQNNHTAGFFLPYSPIKTRTSPLL